MSDDATTSVIAALQDRLVATLDLQLTLKHVHWNVVGMNFIAVHEMLDPQVDAVRLQSDEIAERIATLGGEPLGTPGAITARRTWSDYDLGRAPTVQHLMALDSVYSGVIGDHRATLDDARRQRPRVRGPGHRTPSRPRAVPVVHPGAPQGRDRRRRAPHDLRQELIRTTAIGWPTSPSRDASHPSGEMRRPGNVERAQQVPSRDVRVAEPIGDHLAGTLLGGGQR